MICKVLLSIIKDRLKDPKFLLLLLLLLIALTGCSVLASEDGPKGTPTPSPDPDP